MIQTETCYGPMWVLEEDLGCSRILQEYGEYSPLELALMKSYIGPDSVVIDVGANIGAFTVPLARMCKKVYAFEPQHSVLEVLRMNTRNLPNVEVIPHGLGLVHEKRYYTPNPEYVGSTKMEPDGTAEVEIFPLDSFGIKPDFIKFDIEGMEIDAIAGGFHTITTHRPVIFSERQKEYFSLFHTLTKLHYFNSTVDLPIFSPGNYNRNPNNIYRGMSHLMTLALPKEKY